MTHRRLISISGGCIPKIGPRSNKLTRRLCLEKLILRQIFGLFIQTERSKTPAVSTIPSWTKPGKAIRGILEGESVPDVFIPQFIELNAQGRFPFEKLLKFYSLDQINQAAQDSEKGGTIKPIIRL